MTNMMNTMIDSAEFEFGDLFAFDGSFLEPERPLDLQEMLSVPQEEHRVMTPTTNPPPNMYSNQITGSKRPCHVDHTSTYVSDDNQITATGNLYQVPSGVTYNLQGTPLAFPASANMLLFNQPYQSTSTWPYPKSFADEPDQIPSTMPYHTTESNVRSQEASSWMTEFDSSNKIPNTIPKPSFGTGFDVQGNNTGALPSSAISIHSSAPAMSQAPSTSLLVHRSRDNGTSARIGDTVNCEMCDKKRVKITSLNIAPLCPRCQERDAILNARPSEWSFNPKITLKQARDSVVVVQPPLIPVVEDVNAFQHQEYEWVPRFIAAVNHPYDRVPAEQATEVEKDLHEHYTDQQTLLNRKPYFSSSKKTFVEDTVNKRMWLLYDSVHIYHFGGVQAYPGGADQMGYGENKTLRFLERLKLIEGLLRLDKKVVIDVIEARGVLGFVANPEKYADRKSQNHKSNRSKKGFIEAGKANTALARGSQGKLPADNVVAGPSQKRKRATPRKPAN